jgi:soluble lytic murein transglycosylase-like protein
LKTLRNFALTLMLLASLLASAAEMAVLRNGFSIRHDSREDLGGGVTRLHTGSGYVDVPRDQISGFEQDFSNPALASQITENPTVGRTTGNSVLNIDQAVSTASERHRVDADLISSVIHAESSYNPRAVSPKGAQGLMQLMPHTATRLGVQDAFEPGANVDAGTRYLRELLVRYNGDMVKALAAYNAGPHRVEQYHGVPPYRETHAYVARVIRDFNRKKMAGSRVPAHAAATVPKRGRKHISSSTARIPAQRRATGL